MHHTLNKRIKSYASQTNEQTDLPEELQTRNPRKQEKSENSPNAWRRQTLAQRVARSYKTGW